MKNTSIFCTLLIMVTHINAMQENKAIAIQFSKELLETFTPKPQHHFEYLSYSYLPPAEQSTIHISNISLCMFCQTIDNASQLIAGALIFYRIYNLKNELQTIETPYFWHKPLVWAKKITRYGSCVLAIGKTALGVMLLRFFTKQLIAITCPTEFRRLYLTKDYCSN
jgi:hypothetical protein